jgi:hypothetical protein
MPYWRNYFVLRRTCPKCGVIPDIVYTIERRINCPNCNWFVEMKLSRAVVLCA